MKHIITAFLLVSSLVSTAQAADADVAIGAVTMSESALAATELSAGVLGVALLLGAASGSANNPAAVGGGTSGAPVISGPGSPTIGPGNATGTR